MTPAPPLPPLLQPFTPDDSHLNSKPSGFGIVVEPLFVISLLAAGVIFNRRPPPAVSRAYSPIPSPTTPTFHRRHPPIRFCELRDTSRYVNNRISTTLYRFPFILEVFYWGLTYWVYQIARATSAILFIDDRTFDIARRHTMQLLDLERFIGIQLENRVHGPILQHAPWVISPLNRIYSFIHIPATITFLAYFYHTQPFRIYAPVRRTLALTNLLAFVIFTVWPCMPPRLLPPSYGFVDMVPKRCAGSAWTDRLCDPLTTMPSLNFGHSFIVGIALCAHPPFTQQQQHRCSPVSPYLRVFFLIFPALILFAIVATADNSFFDAFTGLVVAALARYANAMLVPLLALENALFRMLHIHKPPPAHFVEPQSPQDPLPRVSEDALKHPEDCIA